MGRAQSRDLWSSYVKPMCRYMCRVTGPSKWRARLLGAGALSGTHLEIPQTPVAHANYELTLQCFNLSLGLWKENHTIIIIIIILAGNSGGYYINYM